MIYYKNDTELGISLALNYFKFMEATMNDDPIKKYHKSNKLSSILISGTSTLPPKWWHCIDKEEIIENNNLQKHKQTNNCIFKEEI